VRKKEERSKRKTKRTTKGYNGHFIFFIS
jgi:hypothetical protein